MIDRKALKAYLNRRLDTFDWIKQASERELDREIARLPGGHKFSGVPPWKHQKACFLIGVMIPEFLYFLDLGTGKSRIVLEILSYLIRRRKRRRALIVVPNLANIAGWMEQVETHTPKLRAAPLIGGTKVRRETLTNSFKNFDLGIINYGGLALLASELRPKGAKRRRGAFGAKGRHQASTGKIEWLAEIFDCMVLDESQAVKDHTSLISQVCEEFAEYTKLRFALSGTPHGRNPEDLWSQFYIIDRGKTLGETMGLFREAFFRSSRGDYGGEEHALVPSLKPLLHRTLKNSSIHYGTEECTDIPPLHSSVVPIGMPKAYEPYYKRIIGDARAAKGNYKLMESVYLNLRQLASGFLTIREAEDEFQEALRKAWMAGEGGEKHKYIIMEENPKLDILLERLDRIPVDHKFVVFHEFIFSGNMISEALTARRIGHARLGGKTKDPARELDRFNHDARCEGIIVNSKSGAAGLNLQRANYQFFFESPDSAIIRQQAERRCHRPGQKWPVFMVDLVMRPGIEDRILDYCHEGKDLLRALIKGLDLSGY